MMITALILTLVGYADPTSTAQQVQIHLSAAAQPWAMRNGRKLRKVARSVSEMVFEIELTKKGGFTRVKRSWSNSSKAATKLGRDLFRVVPPIHDPPKMVRNAKRNVPCAIYLRMQSQPRSVDVASACFPHGAPPQVAQRDSLSMGSPASEIFTGWSYESSGDLPKALGAFRSASEQRLPGRWPRWPLV